VIPAAPGAAMKRRFTLLELVVVIAIIALSTSLAVSTLRGESDKQKLENFSLNLDAYFSRVRYRATEEGETWEVYFDADTRTFAACRRMSAAEHEELSLNGDAPPPLLKFKCPEKIDVTGSEKDADGKVETVEKRVSVVEQRKLDEEDANAEYLPEGVRMFYFYPDGFVGGKHLLEIKCGELSRTLEVSALTGRLVETKPEDVK